MFPILARKVLLEAIFGPVRAKTRRKVRIGAIFACKVLLEAIFGPVQKWRSRAGWLGLGARAGARARARAGGSGGLRFHFYILKEILLNFRQISPFFFGIFPKCSIF